MAIRLKALDSFYSDDVKMVHARSEFTVESEERAKQLVDAGRAERVGGAKKEAAPQNKAEPAPDNKANDAPSTGRGSDSRIVGAEPTETVSADTAPAPKARRGRKPAKK